MKYRPKYKDAQGNLQDLPLDAETVKGVDVVNTKTNTSVIPNNNGEIKTKYRCCVKGYTGSGSPVHYYKLLTLPINNDGNYASAIINGRIGGWTSGSMSSMYCLAWNRGTPGFALLDIGGTGNMSDIFNLCDLVMYVESNNKAVIYAKVKSYFTFDFDVEVFQSTATIDFDGTAITTTPSGTLTAQTSTSTSRIQLEKGVLKVNGTAVSMSGHNHDSSYLGITATAADSSKLGNVTAANYVQKSNTAGLIKNDGTVDTTTYSTFTGYTSSNKLNSDYIDWQGQIYFEDGIKVNSSINMNDCDIVNVSGIEGNNYNIDSDGWLYSRSPGLVLSGRDNNINYGSVITIGSGDDDTEIVFEGFNGSGQNVQKIYTYNFKSDGIYLDNTKVSYALGNTATTAAAGNHTHTTTLATDTGTSSITLASAGKYKLTAGGNSVIFTMPTIPSVSYPVTDVKINNTSILSSKVANIVTNSAYNASTNKIATMNDLPTVPTLATVATSGSYNDLDDKPTIPATNVIPTTTTANKVLLSTTTSGTSKWSDFNTAGLLKTSNAGVISVDTNSYLTTTGTAADSSKLGGVAAASYVQTTDTRLSDARTPTSHAHGNITNDGKITSSAITTGANGVLVVKSSDNTIQKMTDAASIRSLIGAGTSNLALGNTATTAAAGNHNHDSTYLKLSKITLSGTTLTIDLD